MKTYKKTANCGPVPHPDGSGKMLTDGTVSGDEWAALAALGYVEEVVVETPPAPVVVIPVSTPKAAKPYSKKAKDPEPVVAAEPADDDVEINVESDDDDAAAGSGS